MAKSSTTFPKSFLFNLLGVLFCLLLFKICSTSDLPSSDLNSVALDPSPRKSIIRGEAESDQLGFPLNPAGDIDNDGFEDFIIEVPSTNNSQGALYVVYGGESSPSLDSNLRLGSLDPATTGFIIKGNANDEMFGSYTSIIGDVNKDGYDDIFIVTSSKKSGQEETYVIYGGERSSMSNLDLSTTSLDPEITGFLISGNIYEFLANSFSINENVNEVNSDDSRIVIYQKETGPSSGHTKYNNCSMNCNRCSSPFSCTECTNPYLLYESECVQACPDGSFPSDGKCEVQLIVDSRRLQGCGANCVTCSASVCAACSNGYYPMGSQCSVCPGSQCSVPDSLGCSVCSKSTCFFVYVNISNVMTPYCQACSSNCATCSDSSKCLTCKSGDYLSGTQCVQNCPIKKWANVTLMTCDACPGNCDQCSNSSTCTTCSSGYFLSGVQCVQTCPTGTFGQNRTCESCITGCNKCTNNSTCTTCSSVYSLSVGQCVLGCPIETYKHSYSSPSGGSYSVCDACPTNCSQCTDSLTCTTCFSGYYVTQNSLCQACPVNCDTCLNSTTCSGCSSGFFLYAAQCNTTCPVVTFPSNSTRACEDCQLHCSSCTSEKSCKTCEEGYSLSNALCIVIPSGPSSSQQAQQKASQAVSSAVTGAGSVLCVGSPTFPITALVSQIVQNTRYLNLTVTNELSEIYQTWGTEMISWEVPNTVSKYDDFKTSPLLFSQYGLGSSFMTNFWPTFMTIMVGLGVLIVSFVVRTLLERGQYRGRLFSVVQRLVAGSFNFVIVQVYGCLDDILFDLVLDMKTNPFNTFFSWVSVFFAVGFLAIGCSLVYMNMRVVYKYQAIKAEGLAKKNMSGIEVFNERNKYWELFYSEFNDEDFWSQSALALFIIRGTLSSLTITVFYDYPLIQTSFLVMLDGVVLLFLIFKKPFTALRGKLAQYYFETITLIIHICTFILALQDTFPTPSDTLKSVLCTSIMYLNTTLVGGSLCFMGIEIFEIIRLKEEAKKYKKQQDMDNRIEVEENSQNTISSMQPINQTTITVMNTEIEMQRKPNLIRMQPLETFNLFSENNNTSLSGMSMLKPARALDLSMNADDSVLQDVEIGNEVNRQRTNQNRSQKLTRPRHRTTTKKKQQQQQPLEGLFLRNPARHLREKKPEGIN